MKNLAPVGILTYSRMNHLSQTIEALKENILAKDTVVYIFSDAPQKGDEKIVGKLREYIHTVQGFKEVHIVERETNERKNNSTQAQKYLLEKYGKMIFIEDDIVTNQFFLQYLNDMLSYYENDKRIFGICAYTPNIEYPKEYRYEYFFSKKITPWGFATWRDRKTIEAIANYDAYLSLLKNLPLFFQGYKISPKTVTYSLRTVYKNRALRGDAMLFAKQLSNNQYCVIPTKSLIKNIGLDGSGSHCGIQPEYETTNSFHDKPITIVKDLEYNKEIDKIFCSFYNKLQKTSQIIDRAKCLIACLKDYILFKMNRKIA